MRRSVFTSIGSSKATGGTGMICGFYCRLKGKIRLLERRKKPACVMIGFTWSKLWDRTVLKSEGKHPAYERFCQNDLNWPVSKHGLRSLSNMQVLGCKNPKRVRKLSTGCQQQIAASADLDSLKIGSSKSIFDRTRKEVNYTWVGWSRKKLRWKLEAVLTCKSFVKLECRGERLIEPPSSWFLLKFLSG